MKKNYHGFTLICFAAFGLNACSSGKGPPNDTLDIPTVTFAAATVAMNEGATIAVTLNLNKAGEKALVVPLNVTGSAVQGTDYSLSSNSVTIPAGALSATISVASVDDGVDETNESVVLAIGNLSINARRGAITTSTVIIVDMTSGPGTILGRITNAASGDPIAGAIADGGGSTSTSSATGGYSLSPVATSTGILTNYTHLGFAPQSRTTPAFSNDNAQVLVNVPLLAVALVDTFNPASARTISVANTPAQIQIPAGALRIAGGAMPTGNVVGAITPVGPAGNLGVLPGNYLATSGGATVPFESFGALDAHFVDSNGSPVDIAAGSTMTVRIPVSTRTLTVPTTATLYYFDSDTGVWLTDGTATLQGTAPNQYYEATVTHASTTWTAGNVYPTVNVSGCVVSAFGTPVVNALVTAEGTNFTGTTTAVTDSGGLFTIPVRANSSAFLQSTQGASVSNSPPFTTQGASVTIATCLLLTPTTISIRLTWGARPSDLDSHTLGANSGEHIYFSNTGNLSALPFVALDVDDTSGSGPEVTTITSLAQNRTYRFYVHNYSNSFTPGQTGSPARVEVTGSGFQTVFTPPAGETTQTGYWHVFDLTTDAACVPAIVPVQQFLLSPPDSVNVGNTASFCN